MREFLRWQVKAGWRVRQCNGGHVELTHPRASGPVICASTPSDWRADANTQARLRRALPREPKHARKTEPRRGHHGRPKPRPTEVAPPAKAQGVPTAPAPAKPAPQRPSRRLPGGPSGYRSPWTVWW